MIAVDQVLSDQLRELRMMRRETTMVRVALVEGGPNSRSRLNEASTRSGRTHGIRSIVRTCHPRARHVAALCVTRKWQIAHEYLSYYN